MLDSLYKADWMAATGREIKELKQRGTFKLKLTQNSIDKPTPLLLIWIFKYKFNTDGYLSKFKARLCVQGDLQSTEQNTYAATLVARTFQALIAILAAFDLEI
jgi:hypothetical protein